jgi:hypothetical protein
MNETKDAARRQLENYIGNKIVIDRPFNISEQEAWTMTQQVSWAIQQVKKAVRYNAGDQYKDVVFDREDTVSLSDKPAFIGIHSGQIDVPSLKTNPQLLKLAVKAFAEVAGVDPDTVTLCSAMRSGFLRSALNLVRAPTCIATSNKETADMLIDFACNMQLQSPLTANPLVYARK